MRVLAFSGGSHAAGASIRAAIAALRPDAEFAGMSDLPGLIERLPAAPRIP